MQSVGIRLFGRKNSPITRRRHFASWCLLLALGLWFCSPEKNNGAPPAPPTVVSRMQPTADRLPPYASLITAQQDIVQPLIPLHQPLGPPEPGDWRAIHREPTQSIAQYVASEPRTALDGERQIIYLRPIGHFSKAQRKILNETAEYLVIYFGLPVKILSDMAVTENWPKSARRRHPEWGDDQLLTGYILNQLLQPTLPKDGATLLGFSSYDLWPGDNWNFVFGQASLKERVGVWSIYRKGFPEKSPAEYNRCLKRTIKTATHEIGHMFSIRHCTEYECNMCGSNSLQESDRRPIYLCPRCLTKLTFATAVDPKQRYLDLAQFSRRQGWTTEVHFFEQSHESLQKVKPVKPVSIH